MIPDYEGIRDSTVPKATVFSGTLPILICPTYHDMAQKCPTLLQQEPSRQGDFDWFWLLDENSSTAALRCLSKCIYIYSSRRLMGGTR